MLFSALLLAVASHKVAAAIPQDILFIQADDLGWSDLGCYGNAHVRTPAIDHLAATGMRFTQAYAGAPVCTPSRAATITGLHAARLHCTGQASYRGDDSPSRVFASLDFKTHFPAGTPTLARTLHASGYDTIILGKWGFDDNPTDHGFSEIFSGPDRVLMERTVELLSHTAQRPRLIYLNFSRPHIPLRPDPALLAKYENAADNVSRRESNPAYAAVIEEIDGDVGRILDALDRKSAAARTLVIFTSDNGGYLGTEEETITSNAPLREGKASLYEGGVRVPLIMRFPGMIAPGSLCTAPVHAVEWHATIAELAGLGIPPGLDGGSFAGLLQGGDHGTRPAMFWHFPHYRRTRPGIAGSPSSSMREGDWKLMHFYEDDHVELYDLASDPSETHDLASRFPMRAAALRARLDSWRTQVGAQPPVRKSRGTLPMDR
ncbi:MAG: sulfatase [Opitutaceae bacterium]|nr:sulfatase [Opitutaceae bacterium]